MRVLSLQLDPQNPELQAALDAAEEALTTAEEDAAIVRTAAIATADSNRQNSLDAADVAYASAVDPCQTARDDANTATQVAQTALAAAESALTAATTYAIGVKVTAYADADTAYEDAQVADAEDFETDLGTAATAFTSACDVADAAWGQADEGASDAYDLEATDADNNLTDAENGIQDLYEDTLNDLQDAYDLVEADIVDDFDGAVNDALSAWEQRELTAWNAYLATNPAQQQDRITARATRRWPNWRRSTAPTRRKFRPGSSVFWKAPANCSRIDAASERPRRRRWTNFTSRSAG